MTPRHLYPVAALVAATLLAGCSSTTSVGTAAATTTSQAPAPTATTTTTPPPPTTPATVTPGKLRDYSNANDILTALSNAGASCGTPGVDTSIEAPGNAVGDVVTCYGSDDTVGTTPDTMIAVFGSHQDAVDFVQNEMADAGAPDATGTGVVGTDWGVAGTGSYLLDVHTALGGTLISADTPPIKLVVLTQKGSGSIDTAQFTVGNQWSVAYTFDCSNFGTQGNFVIDKDKDGTSIVDTIEVKGSGTDYEADGGGQHMLRIISECAWTVKVTDNDRQPQTP